MSVTISRLFSVPGLISGLAGTVTFHLVDSSFADLIASTTAGITEFPVGSGIYHKTASIDITWNGVVIWSDGTNFGVESVRPSYAHANGLDAVQAEVDQSGNPIPLRKAVGLTLDAAGCCGLIINANLGVATIQNPQGNASRIVVTTDISGNRTGVVITPPP